MTAIEVSIDETERDETRLTLAEECLASPDLYTREAGAQTLAGLTMPDALRLLERRERIGGQFAAPEGAAWILNSRSRPAGEDSRSMPGSGQVLNSIGAYAPVQEADLTGQSYAAQDRLALAIRLSLFLSCHALVDTAFVERLPNNQETRTRLGLSAAEALPGRYLVGLENVQTGERRYLATDTLVMAAGLGEANIAFRDRLSRKTATEERERAHRGLPSRYSAFEDFITRLTDPNTPFPLRGLERVVVIGDGDSARVSIEALLGYGPPTGNTVNALDRVREVVWIGQKAVTREQFLRCERPRYHLLAVEFPREGDRTSSARIRPVAERAVGVSIEGDQAIVTTAAGARYSGDLVLDCTGFSSAMSRLPTPLASFRGPFKEGARLRVCDALGVEPDIVLTCRSVMTPEPKSPRRQVEGVIQQVIGRSPFSAEIPFTTDLCEPEKVGAELEQCARQSLGLDAQARLFLKKTVLPVVYATVNGERKPIARQEVRGERVYYLGPQAGLPLPKDIPPEVAGEDGNAVALWRYAAEVTAFADSTHNLARRAESAPVFPPGFPARELPRSRQKQAAGDQVVAPVRFDSREERTGTPDVDTRRLLHYLLCEQLRCFRLPEGGINRVLVLQLIPIPKRADSEAALEVRANMPSIDERGIRPLLEAMASDALLQQTVFRLGFPTRASLLTEATRPITVEVAVRQGRFRLQSLRAEPLSGARGIG